MEKIINLATNVLLSKQLMELKRTIEFRNSYVSALMVLKSCIEDELKKQTPSDLIDVQSLFDTQNNPNYRRK